MSHPLLSSCFLHPASICLSCRLLFVILSSPRFSMPNSSSQLASIPTLADFELIKLIGQGYSGRVYLALEKLSSRHVALKVVSKGNGNDSRIIFEQDIQRGLSKSSFVLPLLASWHDANNFYLVSVRHFPSASSLAIFNLLFSPILEAMI